MSGLTCGFIGLGLIGGSIAKAIKENIPYVRIIAHDINAQSLLLAKQEGIADTVTDCIDISFSACDYIFLCAPVSHNDENLVALKNVLSADCLLTDVGSVKSTTHEHVKDMGLNAQFIGGHPMAGSERIGYQNSSASLLKNAYYILTPTGEVPSEKLESYRELVQNMGAIPLVLSPDRHDFVTAGISHLPHVIASTLVNLVKDTDSEDGIMKMIAAGGFKDITRIASSSPVMWQQICLTNGENISELLQDYIDALISAKNALDEKDADALYSLFDTARTYRESFANTSSGPIKKAFDMTVEIADKPGALANVVNLLAAKELSIKNIGIIHNREFAEGSMHIEFYDDISANTAKELLATVGYRCK
ncbi:MAG: prephenate dehydrogenase [Lachnospiraceae bacterium]|nr:prephenate dehydrogenase [Lachnospiraceae bacterium]